MLKLPNQKGQSLLELLIALFMLVASLTTTVVLIVNSINASRESSNRLIATSLAREGIEIVRNIRDSNWADPASPAWDDGLNSDAEATPIVDGTNPIRLDFSANDFTVIRLDNNAFLQGPASGTATVFYRLIMLEPICRGNATPYTETFVSTNSSGNDCSALPNTTEVGLRIRSEVRWPAASSGKKVMVEDRLYNWQIL